MLLCPNCDATLNQDFGMVTCQKCLSVLMIDINGKVQVGLETLSDAEEESTENSITEDFQEEASGLEEQKEISSDDSDFFDTSQVSEPKDDDNDGFSPAGEESAIFEQDEIIETHSGVFEESKVDIQISEDHENDGAIFSGSGNEEEYIEESQDSIEEENDFVPQAMDQSLNMAEEPDVLPVDVTSFANSQDSNLDDGEYLYDLVISRIDSKELRDELKAVLKDEKLKLNFHEHMKNIKAGKVTIFNLNPIKTKRIVEQLQFLDFHICWTQKRVVMQPSQPAQEGADEGEDSSEDISI